MDAGRGRGREFGEERTALLYDLIRQARVGRGVEHRAIEPRAGDADGREAGRERGLMGHGVGADGETGDDGDRLTGETLDQSLASVLPVAGELARADDGEINKFFRIRQSALKI